jgi:hypothetical protein
MINDPGVRFWLSAQPVEGLPWRKQALRTKMPGVEIDPTQSSIYDPDHDNHKIFGEKYYIDTESCDE